MAKTKEQTKILTQIVQQYGGKGKLDWQAVLKEHPEWAQALSWSDLKQRKRIYAKARYLRLRLRPSRSAAKTAGQKREVAKSNGSPAPANPVPVLPHFCPNCGLNLRNLAAAYSAAVKESAG
jgi:hypothetical protein